MKKNILFIMPLYHDPTIASFRDRFLMLSPYFSGQVIFLTTERKIDKEIKIGEFTCHPIYHHRNKFLLYVNFFSKAIFLIRKFHHNRNFDCIECYDPLLLGLLGVISKFITKSKLIIELNGHLDRDGFLEKISIISHIKKIIFLMSMRITFKMADTIKLLNRQQYEETKHLIKSKRVISFPNFVPTHVMQTQTPRYDNYVLFLGYPFYRKGVDILIKAFASIADRFPDIELRIVGFCPGGENEKLHYLSFANGNPRVKILNPVPSDEAMNLILNCRFFVLPSRSEAMGRVLIEAMASAKAVVGSRVGGIRDLIIDGKNGYLFTNENIQELAEKLNILLSDYDLCCEMGQEGRKLVTEKYSSEKYVENFLQMVTKTIN